MVYVPAARYLWDFWLAPKRPGEPYHLFHLQAQRDIAHPEERHKVATVGHAVSHDLVHWEPRPTAFAPGPAGAWDDRAIWTGSIVERDGTHYFFYTAISHADRAQRIGLATSTDPALERWERHPANPLLEADPRFYAKQIPRAGNEAAHDADFWFGWEAFRDPWVTRDPEQGGWYLFFTADEAVATYRGPAGRAGVIGAARSDDLLHWEQLPPVAEAGMLFFLEVPQAVTLEGRRYLLFCTHTDIGGPWGRGPDWRGTHYLVGDHLGGPYRLETPEPLVGDPPGSFYAGRIVEAGPDGTPVFLAWRSRGDDGAFLGGLSDPAPVEVLPDGRLRVDRDRLWPAGSPPGSPAEDETR